MTDITLDVQQIPRSERHSLIFKNFDTLEEGQSVVIVNDHDPEPLLKAFESERAKVYKHEYLIAGPSVWKLKITRTKKESCCGVCGG